MIPSDYKPTTLLCNNPGMVRDCWLEEAKDQPGVPILSIRSIKFNIDGSAPIAKVIRLVGDEIHTLYKVMGELYK